MIARLGPAQTSVGPGDWIVLGSFMALLLVAFVGPNVIASWAARRPAHHPDAGAHGLTTGTAAWRSGAWTISPGVRALAP